LQSLLLLPLIDLRQHLQLKPNQLQQPRLLQLIHRHHHHRRRNLKRLLQQHYLLLPQPPSSPSPPAKTCCGANSHPGITRPNPNKATNVIDNFDFIIVQSNYP
jgi:hypothetical protein